MLEIDIAFKIGTQKLGTFQFLDLPLADWLIYYWKDFNMKSPKPSSGLNSLNSAVAGMKSTIICNQIKIAFMKTSTQGKYLLMHAMLVSR